MKCNFNTILVDAKGNPVVQDGEPLTSKTIICPILFSAGEGYTQEEKYKAYRIMRKIEDTDEVELTSEEVTLIKKIIAPQLSVGAYGQIVEILEG